MGKVDNINLHTNLNMSSFYLRVREDPCWDMLSNIGKFDGFVTSILFQIFTKKQTCSYEFTLR